MKQYLEVLGFALLGLYVMSPMIVLDPDWVVGRETRDLYDHLALLDQWSLFVSEWNYPSGGSLVPPDIFSMIFAYPFCGWVEG